MENQNKQSDYAKASSDRPDNHIDYFAPKILWTILGILLLVVIVGSVYWWKEIKQQTVSSKQATETQNSTTDWKTYTNAEYGFEFNHPADMEVVVTDSGRPGFLDGMSYVVSYPDAKWSYAIDVKSNTSKITLQQAFDENYKVWKQLVNQHSDFQLKDFITTDITVDGVKAKQLYIDHFSDVGSTMLSVVNNDHVYLITGGVNNGDLDKFLSTFKFLGEVDISNWEKFDSKELGIRFQYPVSVFRYLKLVIADGETFDTTDHPETVKGKSFAGNYKMPMDATHEYANNVYLFTGISSDFRTNREGKYADTQGYVKENGKYYFKYIEDSKFELDSKYVSEINAVNATGIFLEPKAFPYDDNYRFQPYVNSFGAIFNLKSSKDFKGIAFYYVVPNAQNFSELLDPVRPIFRKMMESVEIY